MGCRLHLRVGAIALGLALAMLGLTSCQHAVAKVPAGPPPPSPAATPATPSPTVVPAAPVTETPVKTETPANVTPPTVAPLATPPETTAVPPVPDKPAAKPATHVAPKPPVTNPPPDPKPKTDPAPPAPAPAPPPRIEATLPAAEQTAYRKRAEKAILETQQNLYTIKDAHLNRDDQSTLRQVVIFLRDAQKSLQAGDLKGAATLAEKSRALSQDLRKRYGS
jgi:outer membrane biosynthesis protein TonB